mmetsp:Transcript_39156/g.90802  ORF Transcript_39156/g.90802 Transcript_39156/m.90802 type:complete len:83 (+) Transcript_39156:151-399(+)
MSVSLTLSTDGPEAGEIIAPNKAPPTRAEHADPAQNGRLTLCLQDRICIAVKPGGTASTAKDTRGAGTLADSQPNKRCGLQP